MAKYNANIDELKRCGQLVELFCLRPKKYQVESVTLRLKINAKWGGWRLREDLVESLDLEVGNTIVTTVAPLYTEGLSDDADNIDLFASGEGADWLLENKVSAGSIIDCQVRLSYTEVPVGFNNKKILKVSLIFEKGLSVVETETTPGEEIKENNSFDDLLQSLAGIKDLV